MFAAGAPPRTPLGELIQRSPRPSSCFGGGEEKGKEWDGREREDRKGEERGQGKAKERREGRRRKGKGERKEWVPTFWAKRK